MSAEGLQLWCVARCGGEALRLRHQGDMKIGFRQLHVPHAKDRGFAATKKRPGKFAGPLFRFECLN
jgi:hypothetical protein